MKRKPDTVPPKGANRGHTGSTLTRAFSLLEQVVEAERPLTGADLVDLLRLPKPTVHRLAQQLEQQGLLQREPDGRRYAPGHRLRKLALRVLAHSSVAAPRHAILQSLSDQLGETCNITVLDGNQTVYFDRVETNWPVRVQLPPGSRLPLHCTASGKLFLAHMSQRDRGRLITAAPLKAYTDHSLTDPGLLEDELQRIAAEGLSTDNEEFITGMVAVAVPVYDASGHICATVAAHAPTVRKPLQELRRHVPALRLAAASLASLFDGEAAVEQGSARRR
ncbi:IclR family transcriptional regulator [Thioalkalivibrio thiocyanodenitrificans]|uniref:IclR family transcriptional regulator n=1 Tax=Thioalkalivibrio thiocyanodenitrificans TaxID=243063 RepID=UPI00036B50D3|nr:IclR family transcriptional regulator [Thioalkalivibrio thiocyanodenitrificans]